MPRPSAPIALRGVANIMKQLLRPGLCLLFEKNDAVDFPPWFLQLHCIPCFHYVTLLLFKRKECNVSRLPHDHTSLLICFFIYRWYIVSRTSISISTFGSLVVWCLWQFFLVCLIIFGYVSVKYPAISIISSLSFLYTHVTVLGTLCLCWTYILLGLESICCELDSKKESVHLAVFLVELWHYFDK
jgi:hypothetical protein